jgi:hypothetical protein
MAHHAGIDVPPETGGIGIVDDAGCIVDDAGAVVGEPRAGSEPDALGVTLNGAGPAFARVGPEAGPLSRGPPAGSKTAGWPMVLLGTRRPGPCRSAVADPAARFGRPLARGRRALRPEPAEGRRSRRGA